MTRSRSLLGWTGLGLSAAVFGAPFVRGGGWLSLLAVLAVLAFVSLGPGAAVMAHHRRVTTVTAWAMAMVLSLAIAAAGSATLAWTGWWEPVVGMRILAGLTALAAAAAIVGARGIVGVHGIVAVRSAVAVRGAGGGRVTGTRRWSLPSRYRNVRTAVDVVILAAAAVSWCFTLRHTDLGRVGDYGLLSAVHPAFFAAVGLSVAGFVAEVSRGARRGLILVGYLVLLILVIHATTPMLLPEPQYAWTYKHIGVVEFFAAGGNPTNSTDIYQQWPAFFTTVASVSATSGASALHLAQWAPVFFNLAGSLLLFALARTVSSDRRVSFATVLIFQCVNWIEQDYLAPQGLAFLFSLGALLIVLTWLRAGPPLSPAVTVRQRLRAWSRAGQPPSPEVSRPDRIAALGALILVMFALTATHQLSPFLVAAAVIVLVALGQIRPRWTAILVLAIPLLYLAPRFEFVSSSFRLFDGFNLFHNAAGNASAWGSAGQAFSALTVRSLSLVVWLHAAAVAVRSRRRFGLVVVPATLALLPFALLVAQSYGGEAIYRVYLFSAPWCALLIAMALVRLRWRAVATVTLAATTLTAMTLASIQGRHGQLEVDRQTPTEVTAARYLYSHARPGSSVILAAPGFPGRISANYDEFNSTVAYGDPDLVTSAKLSHVTLNDAYLPLVESFTRSFHGSTSYLVISDGMRRYAHYFGALPDGSLDTLDSTLAASPQWSLFYRNADVTVYQLNA